jgi:NADP-dependent 3-hydroxy acid dehydrogenase YdfG
MITTPNPDTRTPAGRPLHALTALVTGGGSGLGAATCQVLAEAGATVIVADVAADGVQRVVETVRRDDGDAHPLDLDVRDAAAVRRAIERIVQDHDGLDVLINNAGVDETVPFDEMDLEAFDRVLDVNLRGAVVLSRWVYPLMKARGRGHIVNIVSTAARRAWPNATAYHASKWGLLGFSHALHTEARAHGVGVTALIAGGMRTPFILDRFPDTDPGVLQDPANVAQAVRWVLTQPAGTVVPELTVLPMRETSWP